MKDQAEAMTRPTRAQAIQAMNRAVQDFLGEETTGYSITFTDTEHRVMSRVCRHDGRSLDVTIEIAQ